VSAITVICYFHIIIHFYLMDQDSATSLSIFLIIVSISGLCCVTNYCYRRRRDPSPSMLDEREIADLTEA
jgi:hypothetical protein